ncbi:ABC transporter substrate-binding protein [Bacillaceae bacterium S4-13-58]
MKLLKVFIALILTTLFLAACSNSSAESPNNTTTVTTQDNATETESDTPTDTETTEEAPQEGGTVRIAMSTEVDNLDPYLSAATDTSSILWNIFDGLLDTNPAGELVPAIAKSYNISDDGLTYTFTLHEGIKFHDGSDLTAEDVVYSYSKLAGLTGEESMNSQFEVIESIEAASDTEVVIKIKEKNSAFLAANITAIVPSDYNEHSSHPIGAGPFAFEKYVVGQELRLSKNANYYNEEKIPHVDEVVFKVMPDAESSILAMQAGDIDVLPGISEQGLQQLGDSIHTVSGPQNMVQIMALNHLEEPLADERVRKAINLAINKDIIIDTVSNGNGTKLGSNFSPAMEFYYEPGLEKVYDTDIEAAKALLAEAGLENGFPLEFSVPSDYQFHVDTAQVIAQQLKQIGIDVEIKLIDFSTWLEQVYTNEQFQSTIIGFTGKLDPYEILRRFVSDYDKNFVNYNNPEYDAIISEALAATDKNEIADLYKQAQRMLTEDAISVFVMDPDRTIAMRGNLTGLEMFPIQKYNLEDLQFTK